jgi:hypothetical protein
MQDSPRRPRLGDGVANADWRCDRMQGKRGCARGLKPVEPRRVTNHEASRTAALERLYCPFGVRIRVSNVYVTRFKVVRGIIGAVRGGPAPPGCVPVCGDFGGLRATC